MNPMHKTLMLIALTVAATAAAQTVPPPDSRDAKLERARQLHEQATAIRDAADRRHAETDAACRQKFFVNSCLEDARQARLDETLKARELDKQARELEREVKRRDVAEREAQRARDAPERAAAAAARAEKNRQAVEEAEREVARRQAEAVKP